MTNFIQKLTLYVFFICTSFSVFSAQLPSNISPQQLEQFKSLPKAQQKSLAASFGVDLNAIESQLKKSTSSSQTEPEELEQYTPRKVNVGSLEKRSEENNKTLQAFGYDIFANVPSSFAPINDVAIPENYIIGTGDVLNIKIFGKENDEFETPISREGKIVLPKLGQYKLAGMTFVEAKAYLRNEIQKKIIGVETVVTLSELRSIRVFVLGEAYKPGNYLLNSLSTVTHAIFAAGGISEIGSLRNVQVKRAGKLVKNIDLYDLLIKGDSSNDIMLRTGDVVFIEPVGDTVTVEGQVKRPAIYELKSNETIADVLSMAVGLLPSAYPSSSIIERYNATSVRKVINVDLTDNQTKRQKVQAGDIIHIKKSSEIFQQSISVIGAVTRPGIYEWQKNQRISDILPNIQSHLLENADLTYSLIVRQVGLGRDIEILQFSLKNALADNSSKDNLQLKPLDKVLVFSDEEITDANMSSLNTLAITEEELLIKEKELVKEKIDNINFWSDIKKAEKLDDTNFGLNQNVENLHDINFKSHIKGADKYDYRAYNFFSRQRLLLPIIKRLNRQAKSNYAVQIVQIDGAVKYPGTYPLAKNSKVKDLIVAAGGLAESAFLGNAELTRDIFDNNEYKKGLIAVNLHNVLNESQDNIKLKSKDRLNINTIPNWQNEQMVKLAGEFRFPGNYVIRRGETLLQLIERAGGFTKEANLDATLFTRKSLQTLENKNLHDVSDQLRREIATKSLSQTNSLSIDYQQVNQLLEDLTKVKPIGRLVIDLPSLLSGTSNEIIMEDGDTVFVASKQNTINVVGQVHVAGSHLYEDGLTYNDYIKLSGGLKIQADEDRIYVIKANGAVEIPENANWFSSNDQSIKPGDTVVVPLDTYFMEDITLWQTATQILYQSAIAVAAITSL